MARRLVNLLSLTALFVGLGLRSSVAMAAEPRSEEHQTALDLARRGDGFFAKGDYQNALALYSAAYNVAHVPTIGIQVAKTYAAQGRLLEAKASADDVIQLPVAPSEPLVFGKARAAAGDLSLELSERIPLLWLDVDPSQAAPSVQIDDAKPTRAAPDAPIRIDPGKHRVRVAAPGYAPAESVVTLAERDKQRLAVHLAPAPAPVEPAAAAPVALTTGPETAAPGAEIVRDDGLDEATRARSSQAQPHRLSAGLAMSVGGEYSEGDYGEYSYEFGPSYGAFLAYDYLLLPHFSLGAEANVSYWTAQEADAYSEAKGVRVTLLGKPKVWMKRAEGALWVPEVYGAIPLGINYSDGSYANSATGPAFGVSLGLGMWMAPNTELIVEVGVLEQLREMSFNLEDYGWTSWGLQLGLAFAP